MYRSLWQASHRIQKNRCVFRALHRSSRKLSKPMDYIPKVQNSRKKNVMTVSIRFQHVFRTAVDLRTPAVLVWYTSRVKFPQILSTSDRPLLSSLPSDTRYLRAFHTPACATYTLRGTWVAHIGYLMCIRSDVRAWLSLNEVGRFEDI